jgi:ABC-type amino acid transport substrate-binding protein
MASAVDKRGPRDADRDDAADASRFFSRIGYLVLGVGAPVGVVLHPLGLYVMFSIGVALILIAAALDAEPGFLERFLRPFFVPAFLALLAGLAWAALSILWSPYPFAAGQRLIQLGVLLVATMAAVAAPRENARATDLYLFPIGVLAGMGAIVARALAERLTGAPDDGRLAAGAVAIAVLLFPAMGGLAARGRNGLARLLLILALCFAYIESYAPVTIALFAGYLALSFAISDLSRTTRELSFGAAALMLLSPLIPALAPTVSAWIFHARLASLPAPYPSLSVAADVFTHDKLRLITGRGLATVSQGVRDGILPAQTPQALAFTVWYELGILGAVLAAAGAWSAFRDLARAPERLAPYMAAAFSAVIALAFLNVDFAEMTTLTLIGVAIISTDIAARSQYRTSRPSAARLANL